MPVRIVVNDISLISLPSITMLKLFKLCGLANFKFCYHECLPIAGNCRICLIEIEGADKQAAACVSNIEHNIAIWTDNIFCKKARENIIEILLVNHPLDCPICDQGGDCDLQDQVKKVGSFANRFFFNKRLIKDKNSGVFIKTIMTRCIHCLRCVRFNNLIGQHSFGILNRSLSSEITYHSFDREDYEFYGVTIDLCPVGALTSRMYAFKCRPWELKLIQSLDLSDGVGSNIYINYRDFEVFKIFPKSNAYINGGMLSDKIRFSGDSNLYNRLKSIYANCEKYNQLESVSWMSFFNRIKNFINEKKIIFLINNFLDIKTFLTLKKISCKYFSKIKIYNITNTVNDNLYFKNNGTILDIQNFNHYCMLLGINPKVECAILNLKLRLNHKKKLFGIFCIGRFFSTFSHLNFVSLKLKKILCFFEGKLKVLSFMLHNSICPLILFGEAFDKRILILNLIIFFLREIFSNLKLLSINLACNSNGAIFSNIASLYQKKNHGFYFFINLEDTLNLRKFIKKKQVAWFSTHKLNSFYDLKFIIPISTFLEEENFYINFEHRIQKTEKIFNASQCGRSFVKILNSIFDDNDVNSEYFYLSFLYEFIKNSTLFLTLFNVFDLFIKNFNTDIFFFNCYPLKGIQVFFCSNVWTKNSLFLIQSLRIVKRKEKNFKKIKLSS